MHPQAVILVCCLMAVNLPAGFGSKYPKPSKTDVETCHRTYEPQKQNARAFGLAIFESLFKHHPETVQRFTKFGSTANALFKSPGFLKIVDRAASHFGAYLENLKNLSAKENKNFMYRVALRHRNQGIKPHMAKWIKKAILYSLAKNGSKHTDSCRRVLEYILLNQHNAILRKLLKEN